MEKRQRMNASGGYEFDNTVQVREPKTGKILEERHYALTIDNDGTRYESPIGSGNFYNADGTLIKKAEPAKAQGNAQNSK